MLKPNTTFRLLGLLLALVLVYLALEYFNDRSRSKTFRSELVAIDTARVNRIVVRKQGADLELTKSGNSWQVGLDNARQAPAQAASVQRLLGNLLQIVPSRIATRDPAKWQEYQVDSSGTRYQVYEGQKKTLDITVGRFGVQGQRSFFSYVRLEGENEVYTVDDFMGMTLGSEAADFRNRQLLSVNTDSISGIRFDYPADSSFALLRTESGWNIGALQADSAAVADYLADLRYVSSPDFADDTDPAQLTSPTCKIQVDEKGKPAVAINAYLLPGERWIIHSSLNPESYFEGGTQFGQLFAGRRRLLGEVAVD
jgi:hypothetical protein